MQFTDASGFVTATSVDFVWNAGIDCAHVNGNVADYDIVLNTVVVGNYNGDGIVSNDGSCACTPSPASHDPVSGSGPGSAYVLGGVNTFESQGFSAADDRCQGLTEALTGCLASVTVHGSFVGGGGDPHVWGPALGDPRFDLGQFARARTGENSDMDVVLVEADGVVLRGHVRSKAGTDRQYFTTLSLVSASETIVISSEREETDAWMAVTQDEHVVSCLNANEAARLDIYGASVLMNCDAALEHASANPFMKSHFSSHIEHVVSGVTIETASFVVEVFYVQKGRLSDGTWREMPFGFFDFHVRLAHPSASFDGLLGSTSTGQERDVGASAFTHRFNEHILGHVTFA